MFLFLFAKQVDIPLPTSVLHLLVLVPKQYLRESRVIQFFQVLFKTVLPQRPTQAPYTHTLHRTQNPQEGVQGGLDWKTNQLQTRLHAEFKIPASFRRLSLCF